MLSKRPAKNEETLMRKPASDEGLPREHQVLRVLWNPLSDEFQWHSITSKLSQTKPAIIPCHLQGLVEATSTPCLIEFCNASQKAYAVVVYLKTIMGKKLSYSIFIAKTHAAPLKQVSIPRLELLSALLLAQVIHSASCALRDEVQLGPPICYSHYWITLC